MYYLLVYWALIKIGRKMSEGECDGPSPSPETAVRQIRSEHTGGLIGVYVTGAADLIFSLPFPNRVISSK